MGLPDLNQMTARVDALTTQLELLTQALGDNKLATEKAVAIAIQTTHRQWQHPMVTSIQQTAAGFQALATPQQGLHYVKILGAFITLDAAGTLQFFQGAGKDATHPQVDATLTGTIEIATNGGFVLPMTTSDTPWLWGEPGNTLSINSVTGKAQGWIVWCDSASNQ